MSRCGHSDYLAGDFLRDDPACRPLGHLGSFLGLSLLRLFLQEIKLVIKHRSMAEWS